MALNLSVFKKICARCFGVRSLLPKEGALGDLPGDREAYRNLIRIALPSVCEMVLISLIGSIDTMMVGGIGTQAIAAVGLVGQPRMIMMSIFFAMNIGVTAVVARRKGQGERDDANRSLRTALIMVVLMGLVMMALGLTFSKSLVLLAGAKPDTVDDANTYFRILLWALPMSALSMCICAAQRGVGNTKITMYVNMMSNLINVLFNYLLINGKWIFPKLGVKGAAIATAIGMGVGMFLAVVSLFQSRRGDGFLHVSFRDTWKPSLLAARAMLKVGGNAMLEQLALRVGFFLYARIVADLGTQAYASHMICMQFLNLSFTFADGIGVAGTSLVGQMLGKERPDLSHMYGKIAQRIAIVAAIVLASTIAILRYPLVSLFTNDITARKLSASVMLIVAVFQPFQMMAVITSGALRGSGDTRYVARVMLCCVGIIRPAAALLAVYLISNYFTPVYAAADISGALPTMSFWLNYQTPVWALLGAWGASLIDMTLRMALVMRRFNSGKWHSIKV